MRVNGAGMHCLGPLGKLCDKGFLVFGGLADDRMIFGLRNREIQLVGGLILFLNKRL